MQEKLRQYIPKFTHGSDSTSSVNTLSIYVIEEGGIQLITRFTDLYANPTHSLWRVAMLFTELPRE